MQKFFRERLKKVVQKFWLKFGPPDSEVLDPLVIKSYRLPSLLTVTVTITKLYYRLTAHTGKY